jgi:hypothetical protein
LIAGLFTVIGWLTDWRVLAVAGVVLAVVVYRILGPRIAGAVLTAAAGVVLWRMGTQSGSARERQAQQKRDAKAVGTRDTVRRSVQTAGRDERLRRLERWARQ